MVILRRAFPTRSIVALATVAILVLVDRLGALFAGALEPGAAPIALPGGWLSIQRMDHFATFDPGMAAVGALLLVIIPALAHFREDVPAHRLMLASAACTTAGILANSISVLTAGRAMDFLLVHDPVWLIRLAAAYSGGPIPVAPIVHFVPADACLWTGFALWALWVATAGLTTLIPYLPFGREPAPTR